MNRKDQFMQAVRILAPNDTTIEEAARRVPEERLPAAPGGLALEFVVALQRYFSTATLAADTPRVSGREPTPQPLSLAHALRVKSAEYWLLLGEPAEALKELDKLPERSNRHPQALKTRIKALGVLRERTELALQE